MCVKRRGVDDMYLIKNAISNLGRNKGRNLILGCMMVLILFAGTVSIMIHSATGKQINAYKEQFSADVILYRDNRKITNMKDYREPGLKEYQAFAKSKLLKSSELFATTPASLPDGKALAENSMDISGFDNEDASTAVVKPSTNMIYGTDHIGINSEFEHGVRKIVQGRIYQKRNEIVVSEKLAKQNGWKVHDTVRIKLSSLDGSQEPLSVKISGIYEDHAREYENEDVKMALVNRGNEIFTSFETLASQITPFITLSASYTIKDPKTLSSLEQEFHEAGLPEYFGLRVDDHVYQQVTAPLEGLRNITGMLLISVLIIGVSILIILSFLAIRERTYEVGVLRAIGMKKGKVAIGFLWENLILSVCCLMLAFTAAKLSSEPIANTLFQHQETISQEVSGNNNETAYQIGGGFASGSGTKVESIQVEVTLDMMLQMIGMCMLFAGVASLGGIYFVMRYEPRKILSERT